MFAIPIVVGWWLSRKNHPQPDPTDPIPPISVGGNELPKPFVYGALAVGAYFALKEFKVIK